MNRNISIIKSTGEPAKNLHGSCAVIALSNIIGMSYEQATAWTVKNSLAARVIKREGLEHVAGTRYSQGKGMLSYKKLRPKCKITKYVSKRGYQAWVTDETPEGLEQNKMIAQCDDFAVRCKVSTFAQKNPRGRFLIITRNHALALINGTIYNNNNENGLYTNQLISYTVQF